MRDVSFFCPPGFGCQDRAGKSDIAFFMERLPNVSDVCATPSLEVARCPAVLPLRKRKMADRIQARAIRRCGELLKQVEAGTGSHWENKRDGTVPLTRQSAATDAGLSERQRKTALRVANVPEPEFHQAVESESPPTITQLAGVTPPFIVTEIDPKLAVHRSNNQNRDATPGQKAMATAMAFPEAAKLRRKGSSVLSSGNNSEYNGSSAGHISKARYVLRNNPIPENQQYPDLCLAVMAGTTTLTEAYALTQEDVRRREEEARVRNGVGTSWTPARCGYCAPHPAARFPRLKGH